LSLTLLPRAETRFPSHRTRQTSNSNSKGRPLFDDNKNPVRWRHTVALTLAAGLIAACHGGASDVVGGGGPAGANTSITLVAYSVPEPGWSKVIPAFNASPEGKGIQVIASYGASGDQ